MRASIVCSTFLLCCFLLYAPIINAQDFQINGGVMARVSLVVGNQNKKIEAGISAIGVLNYNDAAFETGAHFNIGHLFERHNIKQQGVFFGYDVYTLVGIGKNTNLLGSTISGINPVFIYDIDEKSGFNGVGFGYQKEFFPGDLSHFNIRRGKLLMRFSNANHSFDITFLNDFKFSPVFNGEGTDYGTTGNLRVGYTHILGYREIYRVGVALDLFTPKPDYTRTPDNVINSDDGRKNVWHTVPPYENSFYANLYAFGYYKNDFYNAFAKAGINSQKLGAYVQNKLHDTVGLNPRFPWDVIESDKLFLELGASILKSKSYED